jgi:hypothetical protein
VTVDCDVGTSWCPHQLVRYPDHRWDWNRNQRIPMDGIICVPPPPFG